MFHLEEVTRRLLEGCVIPAHNGVLLYTPDGVGNYAALWTRDFAYMVQYAGDCLPGDRIRRCIEYLLSGAGADGWIPDRVDAGGRAFYTAGDSHFPAAPNLDNGPFLMLAADAYLRTLPDREAQALFLSWQKGLRAGLDCLPVRADGFLQNDSLPPHSPYGFTDCICKTGLLAMETLLYWQALTRLSLRMRHCGADTSLYDGRIRSLEARFASVFASGSGMLYAATGLGRQLDVWASCYALSIGFPLPAKQRADISDWLFAHSGGIVQAGQIRHLPAGEFWEKTFIPVAPGTYQNGAYWATATGWFCDAVRERHPDLTARTLRDVLAYFDRYGVYECVNGENRKLASYVVSATNVLAACRAHAETCGIAF